MANSDAFTAVHAVRVSDFIFEQLEQAILLKDFIAGQRLPSERELATVFKTSRMGVRDALSKLESLGLIERRVGAGGGTFVLPITTRADQRSGQEVELSWHDMRQVLEYRAIVEPQVARLAAESIGEEALNELADLLQASLDPDCAHEEFRSLDVKFHLRIAEEAGNSHLANAVRTVRAKINPALDLIPFSSDLQLRLYQQHSSILDALRAADGHAAFNAMGTHIGMTERTITDRAGLPVHTIPLDGSHV